MFTRHLHAALSEALTDTPVVLVNGARQTGKSTLAKVVAETQGRRYLTLDDRAVLAAARSDPAGFIAGLSGPVVMDEVQRAPGLFLDIKAAVDRDRSPGRFLLTGSANVLLLPALADSLAGRMEVLNLWPLSGAELADDAATNRVDGLTDGTFVSHAVAPVDRADLVERLVQGGFPEAVSRASPNRRAAWFDSYLNTVLQRDVRELANLEQLTELPDLLHLLAARSASLLNQAELSRATRLSQTTLKRYLSLLETLFLVVRIPAWARNPGKRLVKSPKIYLPDTGLLAWLLGHSTERLLRPGRVPGNLVETYVAGELLKHLAFSRRGLTLWHYRTQAGHEVDFVLEDRQGGLTGIEVKASATIDAADFASLRHLKDTEPQSFRQGIVLYAGREMVRFSEQLAAVPLSHWWHR